MERLQRPIVASFGYGAWIPFAGPGYPMVVNQSGLSHFPQKNLDRTTIEKGKDLSHLFKAGPLILRIFNIFEQ